MSSPTARRELPAIVFDMDGVLADTERLKFRAHRAAVEAAGGSLDADGYRREMGKAHVGVIRAFLSASGLNASGAAVERYEERFKDAYRKLLATDLHPMPGARELLVTCREQGRPLALVTSSERWMADIVLRALVRTDCSTVPGVRHGLGAPEVFDAMVTADDVEHEKPHPEPYLRARRALLPTADRKGSDHDGSDRDGSGHGGSGHDGSGHRDPDPAGVHGPFPAVAVEDTEAGVASATAAGLPAIAVRHDFNRHHPFERAARVVESLEPPERFLSVVDAVARQPA